MSLWQKTMKRSVKLSKTYIAIGAFLTGYGIVLSNLMSVLPPDLAPTASPINLSGVFPLLSVALLSIAAVLFALPVIMLFVYDKNNGVLEYLLSTGLDQLDIFKAYVKAALALTAYLLITSISINTIVGVALGTNFTLLATIAILTIAIGTSEVFLVSICMAAFSSLQKTPMGANQPLGVVVGVIPMFPALILPLAFPLYAVAVDLSIAIITLLTSIALLLSVNRLIMREKLLP